MSTVPIKIETLGKENFDTWKIQMQAILIKNDLWDYVNGECVKPSDAVTAAKWMKYDAKARSDLILAINPSELKQIKDCSTSNEVWKKLHFIYQSKGPARKATLLKQLLLNKMNIGDDVRSFLNNFFDAVDKLKDLDIDINNDLLSIILLYSLPDEYDNFRCAIESRDELPKAENLKIKIIEESDSRKSKASNDINALAAKSNTINKSQSFSKKYKFNGKCNKCNLYGHKGKDCRVSNKNKNESSHSYNAILSVLNESDDQDNKWCLDSGCTSHMSNSRSSFKNFKITNEKVNLADASSTNVIGRGNLDIFVNNGQKDNHITIENALHVPNLKNNLMSVSKITDKNFKVVFDKKCAKVIDTRGAVSSIADRVNDLYYIRESENNNFNAKTVNKSEKITKIQLWHNRLGHLNERDLKRMQNRNSFGINFKNEHLPTCEICVKGKMSQTPFPLNTKRNVEVNEIIHSDICGPMRCDSEGGNKYFITFIDDKTRWVEVKFLKKKSEAFDAFKEFKNRIEKQTGKKIKFLQTDNGCEYLSNCFTEYLKTHGIQRRLTVPHTPQQNGVAERQNRTLLDMARCMLLQANLPERFWAEAINTAAYIRNRCPCSALNGEIPYTILKGKKPTLLYFKTFGSKAYCLNKNPNKRKFDARSLECILLGYSEENKAYRVWLKEERKAIVTRDIKIINENIFKNFNYEKEEEKDEKIYIELPSLIQDDSTPNVDLHSETNEGGDNQTFKRGRGRPKLLRTGNRGRPALEYKVLPVIQETSEEDSNSENNPNEEVEEDENQIDEENNLMYESCFNNNETENFNSKEWKDAVSSEFISLLKNKTWNICDRPTDREVIGSKLVFKEKLKPDGTLERRKARLVAKGYSQQPGIDYEDTFAPVIRLSTLRMLMALSMEMEMKIHQMDIQTAYLNGELDKSLYMEIPENLKETLENIKKSKDPILKNEAVKMLNEINKGNKVCALKKALYGLKQSGRQWYKKLHETLIKLGFTETKYDPCLYVNRRNKNYMFIGVYVDDIIIASKDEEWIKQMKKNLSEKFKMKDLNEINYCLGIEFAMNEKKNEIFLSQKKYITDLLFKYNMNESKPVVTPLDSSNILTKTEDVCEETMKSIPYRQLIGSLMYLAIGTRPDISYAVNFLSQFNNCYNEDHWKAAKRILRYLKGTIYKGLKFKKTKQNVEGFADADWGNCKIDRKSYTGFVFKFGGSAISWEAKKQRTVALSSVEAEYMALSEAAREATCIRNFFKEIGMSMALTISCDNQGALQLAENPVHHSRTKHIDIRHHYIRQALKDGSFKIKYLPTEEMPADVLTKALTKEKHNFCSNSMGLLEEE